VVDDHPSIRQIVATVLREIGAARVLEAENGAVALALLREHSDIALIISDWDMPVLDGFGLLRQLRGLDNEKCETPFIVMSGKSSSDLKQAFLPLGIEGVLSKPFSLQDLVRAVKKAVSSREPMRAAG
jgi:two-component system chemotaxis response regulator CheY